MITLLFSSNHKIGSRLIATGTWLFESECRNYYKDILSTPSHVAVRHGDLVLESTFSNGVSICKFSEWIKTHKLLYSIDFPATSADQVNVAILSLYGRKYDWLGVLYYAVRLLIPHLPYRNRWQNSRRYFCTELAASLTNPAYSDLSPAKLFIEVQKWNNG